MQHIKILTYNVQTGKKIDRIIDWLNRLPDTEIICLQEFPKDKIEESMLLLGRVPYKYVFAEGFTYRKRMYGELTIYRSDCIKNIRSKIVTLGINTIERRILRTTIPRSYLLLSGTIHGIPITFINVHIVALAMNAAKYAQVTLMLEQLSAINNPLIVLGDFNISSIIGKKRLIGLFKKSGFIMHPKKIATHRVGIIRHQFDYIFTRRCVISEQSVWRVKFSDHFPIAATCQL